MSSGRSKPVILCPARVKCRRIQSENGVHRFRYDEPVCLSLPLPVAEPGNMLSLFQLLFTHPQCLFRYFLMTNINKITMIVGDQAMVVTKDIGCVIDPADIPVSIDQSVFLGSDPLRIGCKRSLHRQFVANHPDEQYQGMQFGCSRVRQGRGIAEHFLNIGRDIFYRPSLCCFPSKYHRRAGVEKLLFLPEFSFCLF